MTQDNERKPDEITPEQFDGENPAPEAAPVEDVAAALDAREAELQAELDKVREDLLRAMAETENVRRRLTQQAEDRGKYAVANFAKDMLSVADNLRRALDAVPADSVESDAAKNLLAGVELTERELLSVLERHGVKRVEAMGQRFNPNFHQAMMEVEDPDKPSGTVVVEMQAGYVISDRLLRPAMVGVSKGGPKPEGEDSQKIDTTA